MSWELTCEESAFNYSVLSPRSAFTLRLWISRLHCLGGFVLHSALAHLRMNSAVKVLFGTLYFKARRVQMLRIPNNIIFTHSKVTFLCNVQSMSYVYGIVSFSIFSFNGGFSASLMCPLLNICIFFYIAMAAVKDDLSLQLWTCIDYEDIRKCFPRGFDLFCWLFCFSLLRSWRIPT